MHLQQLLVESAGGLAGQLSGIVSREERLEWLQRAQTCFNEKRKRRNCDVFFLLLITCAKAVVTPEHTRLTFTACFTAFIRRSRKIPPTKINQLYFAQTHLILNSSGVCPHGGP